MSTIVYDESQEVLEDDEELSSFEEFEEQDEQDEEVSEEEETESHIPEKFKGKNVEDIVKSYQELESEFGRRNNEIGELRKLTDELLQLKLNPEERKEETSLDVDTLLENPQEAIDNALAKNPKLKQLEEQLVEVERAKGRAGLDSAHPDWQEVVASAEFQNWVSSSPIIKSAFMSAHTNYDYQAGSEIISMYKQYHGNQVEERVQEQEQKRKTALKQASVEKGSPNVQKKKVYRRKDLIELRLRDPARYDAMADDIRKAYAEGRVK